MNDKIVPESGLMKQVELELLIPDPPSGVKILENATNERTATEDSENNRENRS